MKLTVKQNSSAIDATIKCRVEWCNPQGVWFSFCSDIDGDPVARLSSLGFKVKESVAFPGVFGCPWESADGGDCYLAVLS